MRTLTSQQLLRESFDRLLQFHLRPIINYGGKGNMATKPAVGSRVRLSIEGVVIEHVEPVKSDFFSFLDQPGGFRFRSGDQVLFAPDEVDGTTVEVLSPPPTKFLPGRVYQTTPTGMFKGVRTTFGKWAVINHTDPEMIGHVLTDDKFIALRREDPAKRQRILNTMELVD